MGLILLYLQFKSHRASPQKRDVISTFIHNVKNLLFPLL